MASSPDGNALVEEGEQPTVFADLPLAEVFQCIAIHSQYNLWCIAAYRRQEKCQNPGWREQDPGMPGAICLQQEPGQPGQSTRWWPCDGWDINIFSCKSNASSQRWRCRSYPDCRATATTLTRGGNLATGETRLSRTAVHENHLPNSGEVSLCDICN